MTFNPNVPQPNDKLAASQPVLLQNNQQLDAVFDVDHYKFSDGTSNRGFHKTVTSPNAAIPTTTVNPKLYGHEVTSNVGTLQFSRGINDETPTPITNKNGLIPAMVAATPVTILDFTGVTTAIFRVSINSASLGTQPHLFSGNVLGSTLFNPLRIIPTSFNTFTTPVSGSNLQIQSLVNINNVYWTIEFLRVE